MKYVLVAVATIGFSTASYAGSLADPEVDTQVAVGDGNSGTGSWLLPLLGVFAIAAVVAAD